MLLAHCCDGLNSWKSKHAVNISRKNYYAPLITRPGDSARAESHEAFWGGRDAARRGPRRYLEGISERLGGRRRASVPERGVQTASKMPSEGPSSLPEFQPTNDFQPKTGERTRLSEPWGESRKYTPSTFLTSHQRIAPPQNEDTEDTEDTKKNPEQKIPKSEHMKKFVSLCPCVLKGFKNVRDIYPLPCYYCGKKEGRGYILRTARKTAWTQGHEDTSAPSQVRGGADPRCVHRVPGVLVSLGSRTDFPGVPPPPG